MNYGTFTLEGYIHFLEERLQSWVRIYESLPREKWYCVDKFATEADGVISFIIFGTSAGDDWEIFQDLKWEYREKLEQALDNIKKEVA